MKQSNYFINDMLDLETPEASEDRVWMACKPVSARVEGKTVFVEIPFQAQEEKSFTTDEDVPCATYELMVRAYGEDIVRVSIAFDGQLIPDEENVMLEWDSSLTQVPLRLEEKEEGWEIYDASDNLRMKFVTADKPINKWSEQIGEPPETFRAVVRPDGETKIPFMAWDTFYPAQRESISLGFVTREDQPHRSLFSLHAEPQEKFAGTGERFSKMDLAGQTLTLENTDGLGVNSRRAYKNVPFYVSSRPYGLLNLTSAHVRQSLADISNRAAQQLVEDTRLDLFFIGGNSVEKIVRNYRRITGFPRNVPLWSYGTWMSRMTYFSADETREIAAKMKEEDFPCDVLHLDTGWFRQDWKCEWEFNPERFPHPEDYMQEMRKKGFRISLWQLPVVGEDTKHFATARENNYIAPIKSSESGSNFGETGDSRHIDFTNPEAVSWYQDLLRDLLQKGAAAIKTDFGEEIEMNAEYYGMPAYLLHNLYGLLYQKAAFAITEEVKDYGLIWARAGWIGCQRYPVHWGGDAACSWDGLAASIRGGLHLGVSGFAFWSHDVPGFHGLPSFMNNWPDPELYLRWTQVGVFTSHLRYHGTSPREPYHYPEVAPLVRKWLKLRYGLIPYLVEEGNKAVNSGYPVLRALIFHHEDDPYCWHIDDQFYFGDNIMVAPIMNCEGIRDVYLPEGSWTDLWTGEIKQGPVLLKDVKSQLEQIPVYVKTGSEIPVYPEEVQCTDEMDMSRVIKLIFDEDYQGLSKSILGEVTGL